MIKAFESFKTRFDIPLINRSKDWELLKDKKFKLKFKFSYIYKKSIFGYRYIIAINNINNNSLLLYRFSNDGEFEGFIDYLDTPIINYHKLLQKKYGLMEGTLKFMHLDASVSKFFNDLPKEEDIEDLFIYLSDSRWKIDDISYGFLDPNSESNIHSSLDIDIHSEYPSIFIKLNSNNNIILPEVDFEISLNNKIDWKINPIFVKNNPDFMEAFNDCMKNIKYYLGDSYSNFKGSKISISSWGWVWIILEFKFDENILNSI